MALALYCRIPFAKSNQHHPEIIRIANIIGRTPTAVHLKIGNFGSFDSRLKARGIGGLPNVSKLDKMIWDEFSHNFAELATQAFIVEHKMRDNEDIELFEETTRAGGDTIRPTQQRINQDFFRAAILAAYEEQCCITGINIPQMLIASHIKPWKECTPSEKVNPRNGLCINALHDRAFDRGFLTITGEFAIKISPRIKQSYINASDNKQLGQRIFALTTALLSASNHVRFVF